MAGATRWIGATAVAIVAARPAVVAAAAPPEVASAAGWAVLGITGLLIIFAVGIHYEMLRFLGRIQPALAGFARHGIPIVVLGLIVAHILEILLFGAAFYALDTIGGFGHLEGAHRQSGGDYFYFSAVVYTTLGFGDVIAKGPLRSMAAMEALAGLLLMGWSTSFTFLLMQRHWATEMERGDREDA